jgi:hypothetical protein
VAATGVVLDGAGNVYFLVGNTLMKASPLQQSAVVPPQITTQPQGVAAIFGASFSLGVAATGGGTLGYQWFNFGVGIPGASSATYAKTNAAAGDAGTYTAVVANAGGIATSSAATVTVNVAPPQITSQPQSTSVTLGAAFSFSVTATGAVPLTYQWQFNGNGIQGANSATYSKTAAASTDAGSYTVLITNAGGLVTSSAATLTIVQPAPTPAAAAPASGGGGGAPSLWFYGALIVLLSLRIRESRFTRTAAPTSSAPD